MGLIDENQNQNDTDKMIKDKGILSRKELTNSLLDLWLEKYIQLRLSLSK